VERIRTFIECGWALWTLHGISHIVYGGGGREPKRDGTDGLRQRLGTRTWGANRLDLDDDDPKIFVSRRSASSDK